MFTCYLRYVFDPLKLKEFEAYGEMWIRLVENFGCKHHGREAAMVGDCADSWDKKHGAYVNSRYEIDDPRQSSLERRAISKISPVGVQNLHFIGTLMLAIGLSCLFPEREKVSLI